MVGHTHLTGQDDPVPHPRAPPYAHVGAEDAVFPDLDAVTDLHQIVELGPALDTGDPHRRPVDGGERADLHIVSDLDDADLRDLDVLPIGVPGKAKTIGSDHRIVVNRDPPANAAAFADRDAGVKRRVFADRDVAVDHDVGMKNGSCANGSAFAYRHEGAQVSRGLDARLWVHDRGRVNSGDLAHLWMKKGRGAGVGHVGVLHYHDRLEGGRSTQRRQKRRVAHDQGRGAAQEKPRPVLRVREEADRALLPSLERRHPVHLNLGIAPNLTGEAQGEVGELQDLAVGAAEGEAGAPAPVPVPAPEADLPAATDPLSTAPSRTTSCPASMVPVTWPASRTTSLRAVTFPEKAPPTSTTSA